MPKLLTISAAGFAVSLVCCGTLIPIAYRFQLLDRPNERSSHTKVTPRVGGLGLLAGALVFLYSPLSSGQMPSALFWALSCAGALLVIGLLDDKLDLSQALRFVIHFGVTIVLVWKLRIAPENWGLPWETWMMPRWFTGGFTVLYIMAFINFFNFMDGINGIAGAQTLFGALGMAVLLGMGGLFDGLAVSLCMALAGAALGFLFWNYPRARTFMGDCGSTVLGFVLASMSCYGASRTDVPFVAFMLPLWPFFYDATFTVLKRAIRGEKIWEAHREHHYQLLIRSGWSHTVVTALYALQFITCSILGFWYAQTGSEILRLFQLSILLSIYAGYSLLVHKKIAKNQGDLEKIYPDRCRQISIGINS
ncbi:MAG: glycosyltransferase family 4 protein [Desulfobacterales bacterium]|nr:glycosyltransferase family 4 protein [Desulfobacterales bacterium]